MKYCYSDYFDIADGIYNDIVLPIVSKAKDEESYQITELSKVMQYFGRLWDVFDSDENWQAAIDCYQGIFIKLIDNEIWPNIEQLDGNKLLSEIGLYWNIYKLLIYDLNKIFSYVEKDCVEFFNRQQLQYYAFQTFNEQVIGRSSEKVIGSLINCIAQYRSMDPPTQKHIEDSSKALYQTQIQFAKLIRGKDGKIHIYGEQSDTMNWYSRFAERFLAETIEYFKIISKKFDQFSDPFKFLDIIGDYLAIENDIGKKFLIESIIAQQKDIIQQVWIQANYQRIDAIVEKLGTDMFSVTNQEKIKKLYFLLRQDNRTKDIFLNIWERSIRENINQIIDQQNENYFQTFDRIINYELQIGLIISNSCMEDGEVKSVKNQAFQATINLIPGLPQKIIQFCNSKLQNYQENQDLQDFLNNIGQVVRLMLWVRDRDVLLNNYARELIIRHINAIQVPEEAEHLIVESFRNEFGLNSLFKVQNMMSDMANSANIYQNFLAFMEGQGQNFDSSSLDLIIIRDSSWPFPKPEYVDPPNQLKQIVQSFESYYSSVFQRRKINWVYNIGKVEVRVLIDTDKKYLLNTTPLQFIALDFLNATDSITLNEIATSLKLSFKLLESQIINLFNPRMPILLKQSSGKRLDPNEYITINYNFRYPKKVVEYMPRQKQAQVVQKAQGGEEEKKYIIDSFIIKFAKAKKSILFNDLISELQKESAFKPNISTIKKRLENLVSRDFLSRDEYNSDLFHYSEQQFSQKWEIHANLALDQTTQFSLKVNQIEQLIKTARLIPISTLVRNYQDSGNVRRISTLFEAQKQCHCMM